MSASITAPAAREFYDSQYHFAEDVDRPNPRRLWHALRQLEPLAGTTFLDLGCGVGWSTRLASERGAVARGVGLDFSKTALGLAARYTADTAATQASQDVVPHGVPRVVRRVDWVCGDGLSLPFANDSFDRGFSFGSMEHFPDVRRGFSELARVLRRGGLAVSVVPNFYVRTGQPIEHRDTIRGWQRIVEDAGLTLLRVSGDTGPALFKNRRPLRLALRLALRAVSAFPPLRYQFVLLMRKP